MGSLIAGRYCIGIAQMILALMGFGFFIFWIISFYGQWIHTGEVPGDWGLYLKYALLGAGIFMVAWFWSLTTSLSLLQEGRENEKNSAMK